LHPGTSYESPQVEKRYSPTLSLALALDGGGWSKPCNRKRPGTHCTGGWLGRNLIHRPSSPKQVATLNKLPWPINHKWFPWKNLCLLLITKHNLPYSTQRSGHNRRYSVITKESPQKVTRNSPWDF